MLLDSFARAKNSFSEARAWATQRELTSFCLVETGFEKYLIGKDGSVGTVIEIQGTSALGRNEDLVAFTEQSSEVISNYLRGSGHAIQIFFMRDPSYSVKMMNEHLRPVYKAAQNRDLDMSEILAERASYVGKYVVNEMICMVLWTRPSIMSKFERQRDKKERTKIKPSWWPKAIDAQIYDNMSNIILSRHHSFVETMASTLNTLKIRNRIINAHDAAKMSRNVLYPDSGARDWRAFFPEDSVVKGQKPIMPWPRVPVLGQPDDLSHILWPRFESQIFDEGAVTDSNPGIIIRNTRFVGIDMSRGPLRLKPFNNLISFLKNTGNEPPWRASFLIEGGGTGGFATTINILLANVTGAMKSTTSRLYAQAMEGLRAYEGEYNGTVVKIRATFATWGPADKIDIVNERVHKLQSAIEAWGNCETKLVSGDALETVMSSVPALDVRSTAPAGAAPLQEAIYVLPWMREASPWSSGSMFFRTVDGRVFPYESGSRLQNAFVEIVYGASGMGKSFLMNTMGIGFCVSAGATASGEARLPIYRFLDIGVSSQGLINMLRTSLPMSKQHQALFHRLKMSRKDGINPFDLPLGLRKPLPDHMAFLVDFVSLLATPARQDGSVDTPVGMIELVRQVIDKAYELHDENGRGTPKKYNPGQDIFIDNMIDKLHIPDEECQYWYNVSTALWRRGEPRAALIAQRYAVPTIRDLLITNLPEIQNLYVGDTKLLDLFERMIMSAQKEFEIIDGPTQLDLSSANVLSLDLNAVAPKGNQRQTAIMYILGMHVMLHDLQLHKDDIKAYFPEEYHEYHLRMLAQMNEMPKCICLDEMHRTEGVLQVRKRVTWLMREGRKYNIQVRVASQQLPDFDKDMVNSATSVWLCGVNTEDELRLAKDIFNLSEQATRAIRNDVKGPKSDRSGAPILAIFTLKNGGKHEHVLINTVGPKEAWSFSTSPRDIELRNRLSDRLGLKEARRRLADLYPGGSAEKAIEERSKVILTRDGGNSEKSEIGAIDEIVNEIVEGKHIGEDNNEDLFGHI